jgi:hypothetical protein
MSKSFSLFFQGFALIPCSPFCVHKFLAKKSKTVKLGENFLFEAFSLDENVIRCATNGWNKGRVLKNLKFNQKQFSEAVKLVFGLFETKDVIFIVES